MRIAIVDDILETHVTASLAAALRARGHIVLSTGKCSHGSSPTAAPGEQALLAAAMRSAHRFDPEVVLLMRPQSWPVEYSTQLRRCGVRVVAWLSDDPVLFGSGYGHMLEATDIVLHCGGERVIQFYDRMELSAPGVNFPFWAASRPAIDRSATRQRRGMFLGHLRGQVRSHRLQLLESLRPSPVIFGQLDPDVRSSHWGGQLRSLTEIERAAAKVTVGLNLPQQFADYRGTELDFPALTDFGSFETPSRVVQYAAMGLAVLTLDPAGAAASPSGFQAQLVTRTPETFRAHYGDLDASAARRLGDEARAEFDSHFTADRRAAMLEALLLDHSWVKASGSERAVLYRDFEGLGRERPRRRRLEKQVARKSPRREINQIALLGKGWMDPDSHLNAVHRSCEAAGFRIQDLNPYALKSRLVPDPKGDFAELLDVAANDPVMRSQALVLVGSDFGLTPSLWSALEARGIAVAVAYDDSGWKSARRSRLSARADVVTTVRADVLAHLARLDLSGRRMVTVRQAAVDGPLRAQEATMALTADGAPFKGMPALLLETSKATRGVVLERVVLEPGLAATPSATARMLRRLRRHGVALVLPVEVLAAIRIDLGPDDASYGSDVELRRKLDCSRQHRESTVRTPHIQGDVEQRVRGRDLTTLLAAME